MSSPQPSPTTNDETVLSRDKLAADCQTPYVRRPSTSATGLLGLLSLLVPVLSINLSIIFLRPAATPTNSDIDTMDWPFHFSTPTKEEKAIRRITLDKYARITLMTTLAPVVLLALGRLALKVYRRQGRRDGRTAVATEDYHEGRPPSPVLKSQRGIDAVAITVAKSRWWMDGEVVFAGQNWGQRDLWVVGALWSIVITILAVSETRGDYLHFTKRLGIIAIAQMPMQYILALKYLNPIAKLLGSSHEALNRWHRLLGRIVYGCMALHSVLYLNFFYWAGTITTKPFTFIVLMGEISFFAACALTGTTMVTIRRRSYRLFFILHLVGAIIVPPMIFLHADHAMPTRVQCLISIGVFTLDIITRRLATVKSLCAVTPIAGTTLVKISAQLPTHKISQFLANPASHVYISLPPAARPADAPLVSAENLQYESIFNPFTVASVDADTNKITLVARIMNGPLTRRLASVAATSGTNAFSGSTTARESRIPLCIDGPYGAAPKHLHRLTSPDIDRILLVAGGVGATFALPVYRAILAQDPDAKVDFIWALRAAGEATWAVASANDLFFSDEKVSIFLTGTDNDRLPQPTDQTPLTASSPVTETSRVELKQVLAGMRGSWCAGIDNRTRPDFKRIVDELFRAGTEERVAIWVCGPEEMTWDLRECVSPWVVKGRHVEWHNEGFGW